jgi:hypothetical protein
MPAGIYRVGGTDITDTGHRRLRRTDQAETVSPGSRPSSDDLFPREAIPERGGIQL